ncbi:MAG: purine-binding chemotaxis protein CheW [Leptospiraceae bacterium]|nr:purine-binding chemotaxis protein CheW [Leptospiraceae bacterium]
MERNKTNSEIDADFFDDEDEEDTLEGKFLIFAIEDRRYGIPIRYVNEIIGIQQIAEVPDMPYFVKGVINLRGKIIPVIDARLRFHLSTQDYNEKTCTIIISLTGETYIGLIVDIVKEVIQISENQIEPTPTFGEYKEERFIESIAKVKDNINILLNINKILKEEEKLTMHASMDKKEYQTDIGENL